MKSLSKEIRAYALRNAIEHGTAVVGKVLPKLFNHGLKKEEIGKLMPEINKIVSEVNKLSGAEKEKEYEKFKEFVIEREEKERSLPELPNVSDKMVFRLAPYPSGALHIGNAKTYLLNALYAEKYDAKILLVMDDTIGSEEKQTTEESYELIQEGFKWLDVKYEKKIYYKSDRLEIYYKYAEELIKKDKAYVCSCPQEDFKKFKDGEKDCPHRKLSVSENLKLWKEMFSAKQGDMALRLKTDMNHPNPAFRDRVLFRVSDRKHPRVGNKYRVWPTLEMSWAVDDHLLEITHILRGNDLVMETDMEKFIWDIFGWKHPTVIHTGLVRIEGLGAKISKSKAQKEVKSGEFSGWDDPRTWSIQSLIRRGIKKEAIREFVEEIGLNRQDINIPVEALYSMNRKLIDSSSDRFSFVPNEIELKIKDKPDVEKVGMPIHPDKAEKRIVKVDRIFISGEDYEKFKGKEVRLLHLYNIKLGKKSGEAEFTGMDVKDVQKLNWVSSGLKTKILMPDGAWISGLADEDVKKLKVGDVVQFERFGFVRFDGKGRDGLEFWFGHK